MKNEDEYVIYESKLNTLSIHDLEELKPDYAKLLSKRIEEWQYESNIDDLRRLNRVAELLSISTKENASQRIKRVKGVYFDTVLNRFRGLRKLNGKRKLIKTSKNIKEVEQAVIDFCIKNNLDY